METIGKYIRAVTPRTAEQMSVIFRKRHRRRPPNQLSPAQRAQLAEWALQFFTKRTIRGGRGYSGGDMRTWMLDQAYSDTEFFKNDPNADPKIMKAQWFAYLAKAAKFYRLHAYNRIVLSKIPTKNVSGVIEEAAAPESPLRSPELKFTTPLTLRQKEFLALYQEGLTMPDIARRMSVSPQQVHNLKKHIQAKMRK